MANNELNTKITEIEKICATETGRNLVNLALPYAHGNLLKIAKSFLDCETPHIVIITGFFIPSVQKPETDGPVGAAQLAFAFTELGFAVRIVSDSLCIAVVKATCSTVTNKHLLSFDEIPIQNSDEKLKHYIKYYQEIKISHIISIERVGSAIDGKLYNMRGVDISQYSPSLEKLFLVPSTITIGIGDGGNEIGMGNLPDEVFLHVEKGKQIRSCTTCNYLLPCGVSNWGAWGILATLLLLQEKWRKKIIKALSIETSKRILENACGAGAVDGIDPSLPFSVDGFPWEKQQKILEEIFSVLNL